MAVLRPALSEALQKISYSEILANILRVLEEKLCKAQTSR
jgi:hypothetical protein